MMFKNNKDLFQKVFCKKFITNYCLLFLFAIQSTT